jgi:hypothetical protein
MNANTDFFPFVVETTSIVTTKEVTYAPTGIKYGEAKTITIKGEGHKSIQLVNPGYDILGLDFAPLMGRTLLDIDEMDGVAYFIYEHSRTAAEVLCVHLATECEIVYKSGT